MARYQVGDRVRVHPAVASQINPRTGTEYWFMDGKFLSKDGFVVNREMTRLAGKFVIIREVRGRGYFIRENGWTWVDDMFRPSSDNEEFE